jgi:crotonobetainyl-CoA:carnitine CoA-transferase CaiB-like acyl-CoA transferase
VGALTGLLVADFSRALAGPLAAMYLGDLGADVIKVERPGTGDDSRAWAPPWHEGESAYYLGLNRNKRGIALDLDHAGDNELARRLVARADVVIENFRPGTMAARGLDYVAVAATNPRVVYCTVSGFGSTGEAATLPGYDFLVQAMSGLMSVTGEPDGEPAKVGIPVVDLVTGLNATIGILAALEARHATGCGQQVEVSLFDASLAALANVASGYVLTGRAPARHGNRHGSVAPYQPFPTADRPIALAVGSDSLWQRTCRVLGCDELADDPRFATNADRAAHVDELGEVIGAVLCGEPAAVWIDRLRAAGVPAGPVSTVPEAFEYAEHLGLDPVVDGPNVDSRTFRSVRSPLRLASTPVEVTRPAPRLGEHDAELRAWLEADG